MKRYWKFHHRSGTVCHLFEDRGFFQVDPAITIWPWDAYRDDISRPISSRHDAVVHHHKAKKVRRGPEHPGGKKVPPNKKTQINPCKSTVYQPFSIKINHSDIGKYTVRPMDPRYGNVGKASKTCVGKLVRDCFIYSNLPLENHIYLARLLPKKNHPNHAIPQKNKSTFWSFLHICQGLHTPLILGINSSHLE